MRLGNKLLGSVAFLHLGHVGFGKDRCSIAWVKCIKLAPMCSGTSFNRDPLTSPTWVEHESYANDVFAVFTRGSFGLDAYDSDVSSCRSGLSMLVRPAVGNVDGQSFIPHKSHEQW
ncbi:uncharacterized protein BCR38DRAFT_419822 [Pseudomassariella vexata]|uniref:Uncharacterized protein n=1 Tax=Pseudomassariella vexata TaxID=1141098 RepID=A0A1Y2EEI8_9PEZI|nr:uncharacterized protein BCR38DRAFT_419822 [Pseudomassariella vexata]ORY69686.1 hypothetical protein BCR38DRAFT_419822 [Pseudomassariella vexata]